MKRRQCIQALAASWIASLGSPSFAKAGERIVLGQSAPFSGPARELGVQYRRGAEMVFAHVNAQGGIQGRSIELRSLDDGYEPDRCAENTRKLLGSDVFALFGYVGTPTSLAALPLATQTQTCFFAPFTGAEALRAPFNRHVFHVRASYFDETSAIVRHLTSTGIKRIGVFHQNDSYGKAGLDGVVRALAPLGLQVTGLGTVERNTVEVRQAVDSILAEKPDAVVQISAYRSCAAFIRAARAAGFSGMMFNVSFVGTQALASELGVDYSKGVAISQVMPFPYAPTTRLCSAYRAAGQLSDQGNFVPNYSSMEGYVAAKALVEGLRRAGPQLSTDQLIKGLESIREMDLGGFFVDFGPEKHTGSRFVDLTILTPDGKVRR